MHRKQKCTAIWKWSCFPHYFSFAKNHQWLQIFTPDNELKRNWGGAQQQTAEPQSQAKLHEEITSTTNYDACDAIRWGRTLRGKNHYNTVIIA